MIRSLLCAALLAAAPVALAQHDAKPVPAAEAWAIGGGTASIRFNEQLLGEMGVRPAARGAAQQLAIRDLGSIQFSAPYGLFEKFVDGSVLLDGTLAFTRTGSELSLSDLRVRPVAGSSEKMELVDGEGVVWFTTSHMHFDLIDSLQTLRMFNIDLHAAPAWVEWFGDPNFANAVIGQMELTSAVRHRSAILPSSCANPNWPGAPQTPGGPPFYQADVLLEGLGAWQGGGCIGGCDGPGGATTGMVKYTPSASLRNSNNPNSAEVPWHGKFTGLFPPYNNDQHPYLIWSTYRIDADGTFVQIGRSGVKHAFFTVNTNCAEPCGDNHILGKGCGDVYGVGNNDSNSDTSIRSEIVPATGEWGRCGSIWDPDCDGNSNNPGITNFQHRNLVNEGELDARAGGSEFLFDGWYVVREDINIFNTMGWRRFTPTFSSNTWVSTNLSSFTGGSVVDRWVAPSASDSTQTNTLLTVTEGNVKVASRALNLGDGVWRYIYVVMNYDFGRPVYGTRPPSETNPRVVRNLGFSGVQIPDVGTAQNVFFHDGDNNPGNNWTLVNNGGTVRFDGVAGNELNWGSMYTFAFETRGAPRAAANAQLSLAIAEPGIVTNLTTTVAAPVSNADVIFGSGFR